jgi:thioredoxin reductase
MRMISAKKFIASELQKAHESVAAAQHLLELDPYNTEFQIQLAEGTAKAKALVYAYGYMDRVTSLD